MRLIVWFFAIALGWPEAVSSQQVFHLDDGCRSVCRVCSQSFESNDTFRLFHTLHSDSLYHTHDLLHGELTAALAAHWFDGHDTLNFYAHMMLAKVQTALKLNAASNETYALILRQWPQPLLDIQLIKAQIANNLINQGQYDLALGQLRGVLSMADFQSMPYMEDAVLVAMGLCFQHHEPAQIDSAMAYLQKAVEVQKQQDDSVDLAKSYLNIGTIHYENYNDDQALNFWKQSLAIAEKHSILEILDDLHYNLALLLEDQGELGSAIGHLKAYLHYQDSIWNRDRLWELAEQKRQFEVRLKGDEIQLLEKDSALQMAELNKKHTQRNAFIGIAIALALLLGLLLWSYIMAQKKNRIISAQKQRLDEVNAAKDQLFSIVAHDLRSPVQSIGRNNMLLQEGIDTVDKGEWKKILARNQQGVDRTYRLLDNLLHWSMSQADLLHVQLDKVKLHALVAQVHYDFEPLLSERNIAFENQIVHDALAVADAQILKVVLRNLLDNAIRFTPESGQVNVQSESAAVGRVAFSVTDTGPGIALDQAERIFDIPSGKEPQKDASGSASSGLGLHLCRVLITRNNGIIRLENNPGEGAKFTIELNTTESWQH